MGWGRLDASSLLEVMSLHTLYEDIIRRDPYLARVQMSNLLSHVLHSLAQAVSNRPVKGALGKPGDRLLVLVCHDTNIANVGAILGVSWLLDGYQRNDTPPGGALVFELWQQKNEFSVNVYYRAQSLEQMRNGSVLSLNSPPLRAPLFLPGCSQADANMACSWKTFQRSVESAINPAFVKP